MDRRPEGIVEGLKQLIKDTPGIHHFSPLLPLLRIWRIIFLLFIVVLLEIYRMGISTGSPGTALVVIYLFYVGGLEIAKRRLGGRYNDPAWQIARIQFDTFTIFALMIYLADKHLSGVLSLLLMIPLITSILSFNKVSYIVFLFLQIIFFITFFNVLKHGVSWLTAALTTNQLASSGLTAIYAYLFLRYTPRAQEQTRLKDVASRMMETMNTHDLAQLLADASKGGIHTADATVVHLLHGNTLEAVAASALDVTVLGKTPMLFGKGIAGSALKQRETLNIPNVDNDKRYIPLEGDKLKIKSLLVAPMYMGETKYLGTISVQSMHQNAFTPAHERYLSTLASQGAIALANAKLFGDRTSRRANIAHILNAARNFGSHQNLQALLDTIAQKVRECTCFRIVVVNLIEGNRLVPRTMEGIPLTDRSVLKPIPLVALELLLLEEFRDPKHHSYYIRYDRRPTSTEIDNNSYTPDLGERELNEWNAKDMLLCPMVTADGSCLGYLFVDDPEDRNLPSFDTFEQLEILSSLAANAIQSAERLTRTSLNQKRSRALLTRVANPVPHTDTPAELYEWIIQTTETLLPAEEYLLYYAKCDQPDEFDLVAWLPKPASAEVLDVPPRLSTSNGIVAKLKTDGPLVHLARGEAKQFASTGEMGWDWLNINDESVDFLAALLLSPTSQPIGALILLGGLEQTPFEEDDIQLLGDLTSLVTSEMQQLAATDKAVQTARVVERDRLEHEIHDVKSNLATGVRWAAEKVRDALDISDIMAARKHLDWLIATRAYCATQLLYLLEDIRNPTLVEEGLLAALKERAKLVDPGRVAVTSNLQERLLPDQESLLYTVGREALNNAVMHSNFWKLNEVRIEISLQATDSTVELKIIDNGPGFDVDEMLALQNKFGLRHLVANVTRAGGQMKIISSPGIGTTVRAAFMR